MTTKALRLMALTSLLAVVAVPAFAAGDRWSCRKFPDHIMYFYNGGSAGEEYDVTREVSLTDSGSWQNATAADMIEVGSYSYANSDQMNVVFGDWGDIGWAGNTGHYFPGPYFPCNVSGGESLINRFYIWNNGLSRGQVKYIVGHEVGHQLGVWHDNGSTSLMNETYPGNPVAVYQPDSNDREVVNEAYCPSCPTVALLGSNGLWVAAEGGGGQELVANRSSVGIWEKFKVHDRGGGNYALQAFDSRFVMAVGGGGGSLQATADQIGSWETFAAVGLGGNAISLRAQTGHYWYRTPPGYYPVDMLFAASYSPGIYGTFYYYNQ